MEKGYKYVLFDLDGTLTDSAIGITNSVAFALKKWNIEVEDKKTLNCFVGPPLKWSFMNYFGFTESQALEAVDEYRVYYRDRGIFENLVYPGVPEMLEAVRNMGKKVILATSKPEHFAIKLMEHFALDDCFVSICGATMDEKRTNKDEVIRYALDRNGITDTDECIMVGDRKYDVLGAKAAGIKSVGVLYGYGSRDEMDAAAPDFIAESVAELEEILM